MCVREWSQSICSGGVEGISKFSHKISYPPVSVEEGFVPPKKDDKMFRTPPKDDKMFRTPPPATENLKKKQCMNI